jgi:hypothetical protein
MGTKVTFNYPAFQALFPTLATVPQNTAQAYFDQAGLYHDNSGIGQPLDPTIQSGLMNLMTAHLIARYVAINGVVPTQLVGPISNATEGSVSVGVKVPEVPGTQAWLLTTPYGYDYWYATAPYRTMRYRAGPQRFFGVGTGIGYWR